MNRMLSVVKQLFRGAAAGVVVTLAACSKSPGSESAPVAERISVSIGVSSGIGIDVESRTQIDGQGVNVQWADGDRIALWAEAADGTFAFEGSAFALSRFGASKQEALFRGEIDPMEGSQKYSYYAVYPVPASVMSASREVSYEIPSVQDGAYHGEWDVMVSEAVENAPGLVAGDNSDAVTLHFHHQVHLLRIRIPENLLGEAITKLTLTFPTEVTGTLTVDIADPQAQPQISGSQSVTLEFAEPKNAGDVVFATIAPVTLTEDDQIGIVATGSIYESQTRTFPGKDFRPGHTTPIAYTVPEAEKILGTMLRFSLHDTGEATLGETVQRVWLEADGVAFDEGSAAKPFTVNAEGQYEILLPNGSEIPGQLNAAGALTVCYDSEHATVTKRLALPTINTQAVNEIALPDVPYLFEEDFSGASAQDYTSSTDELSGIGLPGWGASRYEVQPGRAAFYMYVGTSTSSIDNRRGRMDTPFLPIKEGASVNIKVSYNIGAPIVSGTLSSKWNITCQFGVQTDSDGAISGDDAMSRVLETYIPAEGGDFTGTLPQSVTDYPITGATGKTRLTWRASEYQKISGSSWSVLTAKSFYVYLDDIRVSIVSQ
ncbi:MAG TPA: fimbrillin family protein [Candidatus Alistipes faecavium]|nr:fimbrillin family protein [Candidatus Alistipes faecavium]